MYQAIVFLPLLGAILAGLIALAGARARFPGKGPAPGGEDHATDHGAHHGGAVSHASPHAEEHAPAAAGSRTSELITTTLLMICMILSWIAFVDVGFAHHDVRVPVFTWMTAGDLKVEWSLRIDTLTAVMLVVVNTVSAFVHLYSIGYMHEDPYRPRFFGYLSMFTFAMLMLVTADNLVQLFFGWEGVGLASYLLIGFWYHKPEANAAAIKAFIVNRVGDFGFALGIFAVFMLTGAIDLDTVFAQAPALTGKTINMFGWQIDALTITCLLLFMGAMGKSAQFLLHTWLPDAMEGPTPVSALIHAATMVTAGVFMVARLSPLFELAPHAQTFVTLIGATTALFAATIGLVQNDIKRIVAYSTCSQLGYMFVAMGVGAYSVGMFHLFTHAFFKALLFLGSGSVIHAMHHEQDIRHMGGLKDRIPYTYIVMIIGTLALTGFPLTAGYFSKDAIIEAAFVGKNPMALYAFICTVAAALLTSFYSWRLIFKTFHGEPHDRMHWRDAHESPMVMLIPLGFLAAGSCARGAAVQGDFRRTRRRRIFPRVIDLRENEPCAGRDASRAAAGRRPPNRDDGDRLYDRLALLYPPSGYSGRARTPARRAVPLPAQQVVFRRALRGYFRPSDQMARPVAVEERRRLADRWLWTGWRIGARPRRDAQRRAAADGLSLPLRLCDADRRCGLHHLVHVCDGGPLMNWPILSVVTFLPLFGALLVMLLVRGNERLARGTARWIALWTTLVTFAISLVMVWRFDASSAEFQFVEKLNWLGIASYHMGVDGISLPFVILTTALMPLCILASWTVIQTRVKEYMIAFLVLETLMVGTFSALDLLLFYLFFEGGLIPMFLIIGIWGGPRRVYASFKFFLYTLLGSVLMLLAIMAMYWEAGTTDIVTLLRHGFPLGLQKWAWLAFFASFAVKMPMWPVHTWLPDAHVEAPTAGSVILAAILLKMGGYGFLRFSLPMFPAASHDFAPLIFTLSVVAIIYTSLVALMQEDVKKLIAYSSVAHMGFVTMGIFAATTQGVAGGIFQMISHGIVSGALFLCVGVVYDRMHTREIAAYGGLVNRMPLYAFVFMVFTLANVGLPGTSGFVGEFLSLIGTFRANTAVATLATFGVILSAAYALWLYRKMIFGNLKPSLEGIRDIGWREAVIFAPLVVLTILFGVAPKPVLDMSAASVAQLLENYNHAVAAAKTAALAVQ